MKQLLFTLFFLVLQIDLFSQNYSTDRKSLLTELSSVKDSYRKVELLNKLAFIFFQSNSPDNGIVYGKQALALAEQMQMKTAVSEANACLGLCYDQKGNSLLAETHLISKRDSVNLPANEELYVKSLVWICNYYREKYNDSEAIKYSLEVLRYREKKGVIKDIANTLKFIGQSYSNQQDTANALRYWLQAIHLKGPSPDSSFAALFNNIGLIYYFQRADPDSAILYFNKALNTSRQTGSIYTEAISLMYLGRVYMYAKIDYAKAENYYSGALRLFEKCDNKYHIAVVLNNTGEMYNERGEYTKALSYLLRSVKISEEIGNEELLAVNYNDISIVHKSNREYSQALVYLQKAKSKFEEQGNNGMILALLGNIGTVYLCMGDTINGLKYLNESLRGADQPGTIGNTAAMLSNLSTIYSGRKEYSRALELLFNSLELNRKNSDSSSLAMTLLQIGKNFFEMSADDEKKENWPDSLRRLSNTALRERAIRNFESSLAFYLAKGQLDPLQENYRLLAEARNANGNSSAAFENMKKYIFYRDSVFNIDKASQIKSLKLQYDFDKKEAIVKAEYAADTKQQKNTRNFLLAGAGLVLLASGLIFFSYKRRRDAVVKKNDAELKAQITDTELKVMRLQMNPHFIFNSLNSIGDYIAKNNHQEADAYLSKFAKVMRMTLENSEQQSIPLSDDLKALDLYMQLEAKRLNNKFTFDIKVGEDIDQENTLVPPMIFQPFVENSIWHGIAKKEGQGHIVIDIKKEGEMLNCTIDDDGVGRRQAASMKAEQEDKKKSLGMRITKTRIDILNKLKGSNATVELVDKPQGVTVEMKLPMETNF